jgi:hypothetical protein
LKCRYKQLDPKDENQELAKYTGSSDWAVQQSLNFEFTSRDTLQHNNLAELAFLYLTRKACAMMGGTRVPDDMYRKVVREAIACATLLAGLVVLDLTGKIATSGVHIFGMNLREKPEL